MKPLTLTCLLLVLTGLGTSMAQSPGSNAPVELIVRPANTASQTFLQRLEGDQMAQSKRASDSLFAGIEAVEPVFSGVPATAKARRTASSHISAFTLTVRDSTALSTLKSRWERHADVEYAHPNVRYSVETASQSPDVFSSGDPPLSSANAFADSLDHLEVVRALEGWSVTSGEDDVQIGIVDTGIFLEHPDLADQFWINQAEDVDGDGSFDDEDRNGVDDDGNGYSDDVIGYDFVDRPNAIESGDYQDRDPDPSADSEGRLSGHGTEVAGILSAAAADSEAGVVGVAPDTRLVALRAFGGDGLGQTDDIAAAIVYGATMGVDVLNLSFGRSRAAPLLEEAIQFAVDQGTIVVASAGNEATDDAHYPSDYPEVLSVVWLAEDGNGLPTFSRSQYGIGADLGAPGSNVFTTRYPRQRLQEERPLRQEDLYGSSDGSSFAAPQVAGAAGLLRAADSSLSPAAIRSILTGSAADLRDVSWDHTTGAGRLDVARSLKRALPAQTQIHRPEHNQGVTGEAPVPITGTALDPSFQEYALYFAEGTRDLDRRPDSWKTIRGPRDVRVHQDTLGRWDVTSLSEGEYTLRLVTTLRDGRTIEDRRRVVIDETPPEGEIQFLDAGRVNGHWGILADIESDDVVQATMSVDLRGEEFVVEGEYESTRQGLSWADERGQGGTADVRITLTNRSDLQTEIHRSVSLPADEAHTAFFDREETALPRGRLLPTPTDFDGDGLSEVVLNQYQEGGLSDTLRAFEWTPSGFTAMESLRARMIPRDVGDTDADGRQELLLQAGTRTALLEQSDGERLPSRLIFSDTSRSTEEPFIGTRLVDVDGDGRDELLGNTQTAWSVLERDGSSFQEWVRLENPTAAGGPDSLQNANAFGTAEAATGDFDGDGREDVLVGDRDGDWMIYEATEDGTLEVAWTHETDRVDAGHRFGVGDVTGDGQPEFITFNTYYPLPLERGEYEPPISVYHVWTATGDDTYERIYQFPVGGDRSDQGSIATADFDGDDRDEIAIAHPRSLFVLGADAQGDLHLVHEHRGRPSVASRAMVAADIEDNGHPSLLAGTTGDHLARFAVDQSALGHPPPQWVVARPEDASASRLSWRASGADSVTVYAGAPEASLDPISVQTDSSVTINGSSERRFALRAWRTGTSSPVSEERTIRPHAPATVDDVSYPSTRAVQLRFSEPLSRSIRAGQFHLQSTGSPDALVRTNGGEGIVLRFKEEMSETQSLLSWEDVVDESGLPVAQTEANVSFPASERRSLFIEDAKILSEQRVRIDFNEPLDANAARALDRYTLEPEGSVEEVTVDEDQPGSVTLRLDGIVAGATGRELSLTVSSMRSAQGHRLVKEGGTVRLTQPADDLSSVFVYPNPVRLSQHGEQMTVAGLPQDATVRIYSPEGRLVRVLSVENGRTGGTTWDLRDRGGTQVPSGVYLVRVEAPDDTPVLKKAAVIR